MKSVLRNNIRLCALVGAVVLVSGLQTQARAQQKHWKDLVEMDFPGAYPTDEATARVRDEIDFQRASQAFLWALPAMNMYSMREGSEKAFGKGNHILPVWKGRLRATTQITTPNSDVIYAMSYIDLKDGSVDFYFGPELPKGAAKSNWLKTNPGESWFLILRLYGTMQPYYDQTWKPDDLVKLK